MSKTIEWKVGGPCPNCGGEMRKVPRPSPERVKASKDPAQGTPVPQTFDTAPDEVIDELGDLYRCTPCDSKVRVKTGSAGPSSSSRIRERADVVEWQPAAAPATAEQHS
jgi:hypothetical protein